MDKYRLRMLHDVPKKIFRKKKYIYKINICNIFFFISNVTIIVNTPNSVLLLAILLNNFVIRLSKSDQFGDCDSSDVSCKYFI